MQDNDALVTPVFKIIPIQNAGKSKMAGRPIYEDTEMVEVRIAGDRNFKPAFPAHSFWKTVDGMPQTYAMRWPDQYKKFKEGTAQTADGTPLEELPFLSQAKRYELKALSIYTAEALASLDGKNLKTLGIGGRELKDQATAYLKNASGSADVTRLAAENASMKAEMERLRQEMKAFTKGAIIPTEDAPDMPTVPTEPSEFDTFSADELKAFIRDATGATPRGNPSHETLVRMAAEVSTQVAA